MIESQLSLLHVTKTKITKTKSETN